MFAKVFAWTAFFAAGSLLASPIAAQTADSSPPPQATLFVAADGNDAWSGRLAAPNAARSDGPLATLAKARDALRTFAGQRGVPRVVMVRGGKYFSTRRW